MSVRTASSIDLRQCASRQITGAKTGANLHCASAPVRQSLFIGLEHTGAAQQRESQVTLPMTGAKLQDQNKAISQTNCLALIFSEAIAICGLAAAYLNFASKSYG